MNQEPIKLLRVGVYLHSKRPKVSLGHIINLVRSAGGVYSHKDPEIALVRSFKIFMNFHSNTFWFTKLQYSVIVRVDL
jgi:hypothetical protein